MTAPIVALTMSRTAPAPMLMQQPARDQRADDADHDIADQPKARAAHDQAREPAGDGADHQRRDDTHENCPVKNPMSGLILKQKPARSSRPAMRGGP